MSFDQLEVYSPAELGIDMPDADVWPWQLNNEPRPLPREPVYSNSERELLGDSERMLTGIQIFRAVHGVGPDNTIFRDVDGNIIGVGRDEDGNNVVVRYSLFTELDPDFDLKYEGCFFDPNAEYDIAFRSDCPLTYGPFWPRRYDASQGRSRLDEWFTNFIEETLHLHSTSLKVHQEWCDLIYGRNMQEISPAQRAHDMLTFIVKTVAPERRLFVATGMIEKMYNTYGMSFDDAATVYNGVFRSLHA